MTALNILVVEDDALIGILLGETLEAMGHTVCAIEATEADAVNSAASCSPDLMIVDMGLDEGDGVSAVEKITRDLPVPHVFVSGDDARLRSFKSNAVILRKPFRESDLARAIERALSAGSGLVLQPT